jgi:hypothetical protein
MRSTMSPSPLNRTGRRIENEPMRHAGGRTKDRERPRRPSSVIPAPENDNRRRERAEGSSRSCFEGVTTA